MVFVSTTCRPMEMQHITIFYIGLAEEGYYCVCYWYSMILLGYRINWMDECGGGYVTVGVRDCTVYLYWRQGGPRWGGEETLWRPTHLTIINLMFFGEKYGSQPWNSITYNIYTEIRTSTKSFEFQFFLSCFSVIFYAFCLALASCYHMPLFNVSMC